jgi:hypothetical protein
MARAGQTVLNLIGVTPSAESVQALMAQQQIQGLIYFTFGPARMGYAGLHGNVAYIQGKPVVGARLSLWGDDPTGDKVGVEGLVRQLKTLPKDPTDPNSYSVITSELGNNYTEIERAVRLLQADGGFDVVLPEVLLSRLTINTNKKETCAMPTGPWSSQCGDLPKCGFKGNGSCVMTCESIGLLPSSCDLSKCHEGLSLSGIGKKRFHCSDGSECPTR